MKNYFKLSLLVFFSFFVFSCALLKKQETKDEIKEVSALIVDASIDVATFKVSEKLKPIQVPIYGDSASHIFIDKFGFVKLDKIETQDSLRIKFTPVWITIRDTAVVESIKFLKTQNDLVKSLVFLSLNYAVIKASERLEPLTIVLPKSNFQERTYTSKNRIILVSICPNDACFKVSIDAFQFGQVLKKISRERLFKKV